MVGTSGASAERAWPVTPSARSLPDLTWGRPVAVSVIIVSIWPPSRSVIASGLLLYGTCSSCTFAICCSSSPAMRLLELPLPNDSLPGCFFGLRQEFAHRLGREAGLTTMIWPPLPSSVSGA